VLDGAADAVNGTLRSHRAWSVAAAAAVPVAVGIIAALLYAAYRSISLTLVTLATLPFALGGGVIALVIRGMPFSIPAMVGFIALAGVSVMGGAVMTARLLETSKDAPDSARVKDSAISRFRPMISTALVAALGFIPMAISTSAGAEVQRPLATVVIGGLIIDTAIAVFAMPAMMLLVIRRWSIEARTSVRDDDEDEDEEEVPLASAPAE
jgi:cobalt-zinc-cadmium resistance protein CzcA